jgi:single-strand DNA-binding protein
MNKVVLLGRLTKDIEVRYTESGTAVGNLTLAVKRRIKNTDGEYESDFINCVCWKETAETMNKYLKKGDPVLVEGRIQTRNFEDKDGNKRYATEVVIEHMDFVSSKKEQTTEVKEELKEEKNPFEDMKEKVEADQSIEISDEDLPF